MSILSFVTPTDDARVDLTHEGRQGRRQDKRARSGTSDENSTGKDSRVNDKLRRPPEDVNEPIRCKHGRLYANKGRYRVLTEEAWQAVTALFPGATPLLLQAPCDECSEEKAAVKLSKKQADDERREHATQTLLRLSKRTKVPFDPRQFLHHTLKDDPDAPHFLKGGTWYLLNTAWASQWREFLRNTESPEPGPIDNSSLWCRCGKGVLVPDEVTRVVTLGQHFHSRVDDQHSFGEVCARSELVSKGEWEELVGRYGQVGDSSAIQLTKGDDGPVWTPAICEACHAKATREIHDQRTNFEGKFVKVLKLKDTDPVPATTSDGSVHGVDVHSSGRPKRDSRRGSHAFAVDNVNSTDKVGLLKLKLFEIVEDVQPQQMSLFYLGQRLEDEEPLSTYGVKAEATVYLKVQADGSSGATMEDYLGYWGGADRPRGAAGEERGFQGTLLQPGFPSAAPSTATPMECDVDESGVVTLLGAAARPGPSALDPGSEGCVDHLI